MKYSRTQKISLRHPISQQNIIACILQRLVVLPYDPLRYGRERFDERDDNVGRHQTRRDDRAERKQDDTALGLFYKLQPRLNRHRRHEIREYEYYV